MPQLVARIPVTIASSASLSSAVKLRGELLTIIEMPGAWDAAYLTFQTSGDGSTFMNLYDENGSEVTVTAAVSRRIRLSRPSGPASPKSRSTPVHQAQPLPSPPPELCTSKCGSKS